MLWCFFLAFSSAIINFSLGFKPIQDDFQHDFALMTDEADRSVALAQLQVALLGSESMGRPFSCSPNPVSYLYKISTIVSPRAGTGSAGILSTPADFSFFSDATAISTSSRRIGCRSSSGG